MKKHIEKIKRQYKDELMKAGLVILGAVTGTVLIKGIRKFTAENPTLDGIAQYGMPVLTAGGGFLITAATDEKSKAKYFGYGLEVAGIVEGVKLIPIAQEYLSGLLGNSDIPSASQYYTEDAARAQIMEGFGLSSLPVGNAAMQEVGDNGTHLPDLEGQEDQDLGYNGESTSDVDVRGII